MGRAVPSPAESEPRPEPQRATTQLGSGEPGVAAPSPIIPGTEWFVQRVHGPLNTLWRHGFRFLFVLDALALVGLMVVINLVRFGRDWPTYPLSHYAAGFSIATAIHLVINYFAGLYEREPRLGSRPWTSRTLVATAIGVGVQGLAFVILDRYLMPRLNLIIFGGAAALVLAGNRRLSKILAVRRQGPPRVVLVGTATDVELAAGHLGESDRDARVVGTSAAASGLAETIRRTGATDVLLLDVHALGDVFPEPLLSLEPTGIGFLQRVSARETLLGLRNVRQVAGMPFVRLRAHTVPSHQLVFKRLFDLVVVIAAAPLWLPVLGVLAAWIRLRHGRPVFYVQERVGRDGILFSVRKFRTMVVDAERHGIRLATVDDPRVLPGLRWLRSTRLDELPQLLNILRGEMSLVGPRPERPELEQAIAARVPGYVRRHELRPGLTGLAQIHGRYATDAAYKLGYDLQYLVNWTAVLDIQILLRTIWVVVSRRV